MPTTAGRACRVRIVSYRDMALDAGIHIDGGMSLEDAAAWLEQGDREEADRYARAKQPPSPTDRAGDDQPRYRPGDHRVAHVFWCQAISPLCGFCAEPQDHEIHTRPTAEDPVGIVGSETPTREP